MAYAINNPVKKATQMGDTNSLWYYTDGDAITLIDDADYFLLATADLTAGDVIIVNSGGANAVVDILIVSAATSSTVTTVILA
jgi:hypothetical protein